MHQDYLLQEKQGWKNQESPNEPQTEINTIIYFAFLILQLALCIGWACLIGYTSFGNLLIKSTESFAISYSIIGGFSFITLILIKVLRNSQFAIFLGALFLISNPLFVAYSILGLILNFTTQLYPNEQPETNMWFIYITLGTLLIYFICIPNRFRKFRWLGIIFIPLIYSIIAKYTYTFYDMSFSIWIGIFGVICLLLSEQPKQDHELLVALDSFGFVFLMVIKVFQYMWKQFYSPNISSSVLELQDLDKAKFITYSYLIACLSFLLVPQMEYMLFNSDLFMFAYLTEGSYINNWQFYYYYYYYYLNSGYWIFFALNYSLHITLFLTNKILTIGYKSIIAYVYLAVHLIYLAGALKVTYVMSFNQYIQITCQLCYVGNSYISPYLQPLIFCYYLMIMVQQLMLLITAILIAYNRKFCISTLNHALLILSLLVFGFSGFVQDFVIQDFYFIILFILVLSILLIYLGKQIFKEDSYFLYFNDDEYLISGALLSEPFALYLYQSVYIHFRWIFGK